MNIVLLGGRLTRDPEIRTTQSNMKTAKFTLAVDRAKKDSGADFISCVAFDRNADFAEKWLKKGRPIIVHGRIQTGSYQNKEGRTVYTTDVMVDRMEFMLRDNTAGDNAPEDGTIGGRAIPNPYEPAQAQMDLAKQAKMEDFEEIDADSDLPF